MLFHHFQYSPSVILATMRNVIAEELGSLKLRLLLGIQFLCFSIFIRAFLELYLFILFRDLLEMNL